MGLSVTLYNLGMCAKKRQSGQAILEYVLLLIVSLILVGGIVFRFSDGFRNWAERYFVGEDSFLHCLIINGVLPGSGTCDRPDFKLGQGRLAVPTNTGSGPGSGSGSGSGTGSGSGGRSNSSNSANSNNANADANANGADGDRAAKTKGDGPNGSGLIPATGNLGGMGGSQRRGSSTFADDIDKLNKSKASYTGSDKSSSGNLGEALGFSTDGGRPRNVPIRGFVNNEEDRRKSAKIPANERDIKTARELAAEKAKRAKEEELKAQSFSIGKLIKYLLIFAIAFSIIFFVGSMFFAGSRGKRRR